jgi:hypothetical protein
MIEKQIYPSIISLSMQQKTVFPDLKASFIFYTILLLNTPLIYRYHFLLVSGQVNLIWEHYAYSLQARRESGGLCIIKQYNY